jgi:hypothetical protein
MNWIVAIALILSTSQALIVQQTDGALRTELYEQYKAWFVALDRGDGAAMDAMEVDDFILVGADGSIVEKNGPRAGNQRPIPEVAPERTWANGIFRRFGDTAILTGTITLKTPKWTRTMGTTAVFVRRGNKWLMASVQWTPQPARNGSR